MEKPTLLQLSLILTATLYAGIAHSECVMSTYKVYGVVTNSSGQKIPASVRFSWVENKSKERHLPVLTDVGDYSANLYFDTQSKADKASGRIYNCDAKLNSVEYRVAAPDYTTLSGAIKLSGFSTQANFTLQPNMAFERDAPKAARPSTLLQGLPH